MIGIDAKKLKSGSFQTEREIEYRFIKDKSYPILTINRVDEKYDRLLLEVENTQELANQIDLTLN